MSQPIESKRLSIIDLESQPPLGPEILTDKERHRADSYRHQKDQRRFVLGRLWQRCVIAESVNCSPSDVVFHEDEKSAPKILIGGRELAFGYSYSKSASVGCVFLSPTIPVGVDIESVRHVPEAFDIAAHHFSVAERAKLSSVDAADLDLTFLAVWTMKEAVTKALGVGITTTLSALEGDLPSGKTKILDDADSDFSTVVRPLSDFLRPPAKHLWHAALFRRRYKLGTRSTDIVGCVASEDITALPLTIEIAGHHR